MSLALFSDHQTLLKRKDGRKALALIALSCSSEMNRVKASPFCAKGERVPSLHLLRGLPYTSSCAMQE